MSTTSAIWHARARGQPAVRRPVAAADLGSSLRQHLRWLLGGELNTAMLEQELEQVRYDSRTLRVCVVQHNGRRSEYRLPQPIRQGVRNVGVPETARIPRISRLMALAIKLERLICEGEVRSSRELAAAGHISRTRVSQILRLTNLAPLIQEEVLFLPKTLKGKDCISESALRKIAGNLDWGWQMQQFRLLLSLSST